MCLFFTTLLLPPFLFSDETDPLWRKKHSKFFPSAQRSPQTWNPRLLHHKPHRSSLDITRVNKEEASPEKRTPPPTCVKEEEASPEEGRKSFTGGEEGRSEGIGFRSEKRKGAEEEELWKKKTRVSL
ncbi:hypothetical protein ACLB2K_031273 [Fragaria x ananassa]